MSKWTQNKQDRLDAMRNEWQLCELAGHAPSAEFIRELADLDAEYTLHCESLAKAHMRSRDE